MFDNFFFKGTSMVLSMARGLAGHRPNNELNVSIWHEPTSPLIIFYKKNIFLKKTQCQPRLSKHSHIDKQSLTNKNQITGFQVVNQTPQRFLIQPIN